MAKTSTAYYAVAWTKEPFIRVARSTSPDNACIQCFGLVKKNMTVERFPCNPRQMLATAKQQFLNALKAKHLERTDLEE